MLINKLNNFITQIIKLLLELHPIIIIQYLIQIIITIKTIQISANLYIIINKSKKLKYNHNYLHNLINIKLII